MTSAGVEEIEQLLKEADDWYRHGAYSRLIYVDGSLDYWRERLRSTTALGGTNSFFWCEVTIPYSGYLLPSGWEWLTDKHNRADSAWRQGTGQPALPGFLSG